MYADAFSSPKQTILHRYQNEINTVNQLQLNSNNVHLLIPRFMKSLCVITIKLNTLTDVPYQMTVSGTFVYVCERDRVDPDNALLWSVLILSNYKYSQKNVANR